MLGNEHDEKWFCENQNQNTCSFDIFGLNQLIIVIKANIRQDLNKDGVRPVLYAALLMKIG